VCDEHRHFVYELEKQEKNFTPEDQHKVQSTATASHLFVQTALLYTTSEGERRIRAHNLALPFTENRNDPFENIDLNQLNAFLMQQAISRLDTLPNFQGTRSFVQLSYSNICQAVNSIY